MFDNINGTNFYAPEEANIFENPKTKLSCLTRNIKTFFNKAFLHTQYCSNITWMFKGYYVKHGNFLALCRSLQFVRQFHYINRIFCYVSDEINLNIKSCRDPLYRPHTKLLETYFRSLTVSCLWSCWSAYIMVG